jgi:nicotinamidase-related amidase
MPSTALIVVDMLNPYDHEDADKLAESVRDALPQVVSLRDRALDAEDTLLAYVNDNYDAWEVTSHDLVSRALDGRHPDLIEPIAPRDPVPFILKGRHSIFYQTPLDHLLQTEEVKRLVLAGQVTEQCIFYSALDANMRGYDLVVPTDAVAHIVPEFSEAALGMMRDNLHAELSRAEDVTL